MDLFLYREDRTNETYLYIIASDAIYLTALKLKDRNQKTISTLENIHMI